MDDENCTGCYGTGYDSNREARCHCQPPRTDDVAGLVREINGHCHVRKPDSPYPFGYRTDQMQALARTLQSQAAEIARLRGVLERWRHYGCPDCGGDCGSANPPITCCIMLETAAALAQQGGDDGQ